MDTKSKLETASVLAFERNFDISDAVFFQSDNKTPVIVKEKSIRGTISNRLKNAIASDPAKLDAEIEKANLQRVDVAMLDHDKDILLVNWSCKILPFTGMPCVCNNLNYQERLINLVKEYVSEHGLKELASRYATNILNGRWLWRNRMSAQSIEMEITLNSDKSDEVIKIANAKKYLLNQFDTTNSEINKLALWIEEGLLGKRFIIFNVSAKLKMGFGQEVYPSQELILDAGKTKSKVLYSKDNQAGLHSQKIGNAVRTIDTWYQENAQFPIAIEPYGSVTNMGHAFRQPKQKNDFYTLFDNWVLKSEKPSADNQHYVMGILIRGGVFGASSKE